MSIKQTLLSVAMLVSLLGLSGCSQSKIDGLSGQWRLFWINDLADPNIYVWDFTDGRLNILKYPPTGDPFVIAEADYTTSAEFLDAVIEISNLTVGGQQQWATPHVSVGEWTIDEIDEEIMRLDTKDQGGYVIREFVRVK